jgi:hypothetical protein
MVVLTNRKSCAELVEVNAACRRHGVHFLATGCHGLLGYCFTDLGNDFVVVDKDGEKIKDGAVVGISEDGVVDAEEHGLADGDQVTFVNVEGIPALNDGKVGLGGSLVVPVPPCVLQAPPHAHPVPLPLPPPPCTAP